MKSSPIIIIGAGRSGTNMLRDVLVQLPGVKTWPCDEVNYIWRHGNRNFATDEFTRSMATPKIKRYIRNAFGWVERAYQADVVVEKTCANSLRCSFVHEVVPEAKFIHLVRDGRDVCISAGERWQASLDIPYLARKARFVPASDLLYYASRYIANRIYRVASGKKRLAVWGPKFSGIEDAFREHSLAEACAIQWQYCVRSAVRQLSELPHHQVHTLRYEDLTSKPVEQLAAVLSFLQIDYTHDHLAELTKGVNNKSVGRWKSKIPSDQVELIHQLIGDELRLHGYQ
jgi:Sulfotransferase family